MIQVTKSKEPACLKELRKIEGISFNSLQGDCLQKTRELLKSDQKGLCAYCQSILKSTVFIEHYIPQSKDSLKHSKHLKYSNFFGVCSGKYYVDKMTGKHIEFCSCSRGNIELKINPEVEESIATIYYDEQNKIRSTNSDIDFDLNNTLNLNFNEICEDRNNTYSNYVKGIFIIGQKLKLTKIEIYKKALRSLSSQTKEFHGFIVYRLNKIIKYQSSK